MSTIIVLGLGPGDIKYLTFEAFNHLTSSTHLYARTIKHPTIDALKEKGITFDSFDSVYDRFDDFDLVYEAIAKEVIEIAKEKGTIIYAVPGNPFVAEKTVEIITKEAACDPDLEVEYVYGPSFIDAIITRLGKDPVNGLNIVDALKIDRADVNTLVDNLFIQVYDNEIASELKIRLALLYGDDHECILIRGAGISGVEVIKRVPIYELDRTEIPDHLTSVYVEKMPDTLERKYFFGDLVRIMSKLRGPDGCPWDREQTHESIKQNLIEEAYEVIDVIDKVDVDGLVEELGDVLLQIVFHAQMASEDGYFDISDVTDGICKKLITRHPHVFSDLVIETADDVVTNWEKIKREEKNETVTQSMERIPSALPALMRAYKVQKKAAEVGFDWDDVKDAIDKIEEELEEFKTEHLDQNKEKAVEELGDLIFAIVNVCRFFKVNPDFALNKTIQKFIKRFSFIEESVTNKGLQMSDLTLEQLDVFWDMAKKNEKK